MKVIQTIVFQAVYNQSTAYVRDIRLTAPIALNDIDLLIAVSA